MDSSSMKASALDLLSAILGGKTGRLNKTLEGYYTIDATAEVLLMENKEALMIMTTSVAVLIGCVLALMWRRSDSNQNKVKSVEQFVKPVKVDDPVVEVDDGRKKVVVFYGTQTGTAEGFAKALAEEAKGFINKSLSPDVAFALAPDVEYHMREIMQEAVKCMRHSRRTILTMDDVDGALTLKNVEPIYGFATGDPLRFKRAIGHKDLFYLDEKDVDFKDVIEAPLPRAPLDMAVSCHRLAIEGVQPAIPENAPLQADGKKSKKRDGLQVDIKLPVKHVLSRELQLHFDKITELTLTKPLSVLFKEALINSITMTHSRLHAHALTLAALAGAAVVKYYDHKSGAKAECYTKFLDPNPYVHQRLKFKASTECHLTS